MNAGRRASHSYFKKLLKWRRGPGRASQGTHTACTLTQIASSPVQEDVAAADTSHRRN